MKRLAINLLAEQRGRGLAHETSSPLKPGGREHQAINPKLKMDLIAAA